MPYKTEILSGQHARADFDCGIPSLDRYLHKQAGQDQSRQVAAVFVLCTEDTKRVIGYYTLSATTLGLEDLSERDQKKLPRYPKIPATLIGRLAVDRSARGKGYGRTLLLDAMIRALNTSVTVGSFAVVVDALELKPDPIVFYESYGFLRLRSVPRTLYLPMATIRKLAERFLED